VADVLEPFDGLAAYADGGRIGRNQFGVSGLQLDKLLEQPVVLRVGDEARTKYW
jgi:hypothetical protein